MDQLWNRYSSLDAGEQKIDLEKVVQVISKGDADHSIEPLRNQFAIRVVSGHDGFYLSVEPFNLDDASFLKRLPHAYLFLYEILLDEGLPVKISNKVIQAARSFSEK